MHPTPSRARAGLAVVSLFLLALTGCTTIAEDQAKVVVDDKYVTLDAPVGSHMKRRIRISEASKPGISPTRKDIVTADTDTHLLPTSTAEMERSISDRPVGN